MSAQSERQLRALLDEFPGLTAEKGTKHWKLKAPDGTLVGIVGFGRAGGRNRSDRGQKNLLAQIRRHPAFVRRAT